MTRGFFFYNRYSKFRIPKIGIPIHINGCFGKYENDHFHQLDYKQTIDENKFEFNTDEDYVVYRCLKNRQTALSNLDKMKRYSDSLNKIGLKISYVGTNGFLMVINLVGHKE